MRRIILWGLVSIMSTVGLGCGGYTHAVVVAESTPGHIQAARVHFRNGMRLYERGYYSRAALQFELCIEQDPSYWEAHYYLADCYRELSYYDRCLDHYYVVLDLYHEPVWVARVQYNIGIVYERQGKYGDARTRYELALKAKPGYGPAKKSRDRLLSKRIKEVKADEGRKRGRGKKSGD
ncbi:MAG: tetratricopeptide repeat protein [candidate division Zixibacteria bacterium]|nr:tetratricopeptide repeat protein [candidate division Zixibacteria bacterium]